MSQQTMAADVARPTRSPASRLGFVLALAISLIVIHALGSNFANEWAGRGVALSHMAGAVVPACWPSG